MKAPKLQKRFVPNPPSFRKPKVRGEWVEMKFMVRAAETGLMVSKPYGDSAHFDFVVGQSERLHRVQVRGTSSYIHSCSFICSMTWGNPRQRYAPGDFDFLAVYVIPCDMWYVIPMAALQPVPWNVSLYPHNPNSRGKQEKYREAFHLLG